MRSIIFALTAVLTLNAQAREYKLKEVVSKYVTHSPDLRAAHAQYMASEYSAKTATSKFFPNVSLNGSITDYRNPSLTSSPLVSTTGKIYKGSLDVVQPILAGGGIWHGMQAAQLNRSLQEQNYLNTKQESIGGIIQAALQVGALKEQIKIIEESQKYQERFLNLTKNKAERGASRAYELNQARADYLSYAPRLETLRASLRDAEDRLRTNLGLETNEPIDIVIPTPSKTAKMEYDKLLEQASMNRPRLRMAQLGVEIAKENKWLSLAEDLPSLNLVGSVGYQSPTEEDFNKESTKFHAIGVTLKIPIFSGLSSVHKYRSGEEGIRVAEETLASTRNTLQQDVRQAMDSIDSSSSLFNTSGDWATEARKALNSSIDSYRIGVMSSVQVIQVQRGWEAAELSLINSKLGYQTSLLNLRKVIGTDLEKVYTEN